jgi:hypothetical protein
MKIYTLLFIIFLSFASLAQNSSRIFISTENKNAYLKINVNDGFYKISSYSSKIIETTFIPKGEKEFSESHAVILKPTSTIQK